MEQNKKRNNVLVWFIIVILLGACFYFGYELYGNRKIDNKLNTEEKIEDNINTEKEEEQIKEEELGVNDFLVQKLTKLISYDDVLIAEMMNNELSDKTSMRAKDFSNQAKLYLAYLNVKSYQKKDYDLENYDRSKVDFTYKGSDFSKYIYDDTKALSTIKGSVMSLLVQEIFGEDNYHATSFAPRYNMLSTVYFYNASADEYVEYSMEGGGTGGFDIVKIDNASKNGNQVNIIVNYEGSYTTQTYSFKYTFIKINDNYYFDSVSRTN